MPISIKSDKEIELMESGKILASIGGTESYETRDIHS